MTEAHTDVHTDVNGELRLDGRTAWVTGAGKGLGRAIAVALSQAGASVAVTARTASDLERLEAERAEHGGKVLVLPGSVDDSAAVRTMVERIHAWSGRLDAVINCAGISPTSPAASGPPTRTGARCWTSTSRAPSTAAARRAR